jgi:murein DD-endopeptidase MepM/ murein hydrolase activator NlpD
MRFVYEIARTRCKQSSFARNSLKRFFMHLRRIFVACTLAASASTVALAELVDLKATQAQILDLNPDNQSDRLEQLTKTLAEGSYSELKSTTDVMMQPTQLNVTIRGAEKTTVLNNEMLEKKYPSTTVAANYSTQTIATSTSPYSWLLTHPLPNGRVSSNYGGRTMGGRAENHSGLDLAAPTGTPIYATGPGVVTKSGWGTGYGQYVEINHGDGYVTRYAHASRLIARVGQRVKAGEHIANVGCTGRCTGPHLHYEVVKNGQRKNPSPYLALLR